MNSAIDPQETDTPPTPASPVLSRIAAKIPKAIRDIGALFFVSILMLIALSPFITYACKKAELANLSPVFIVLALVLGMGGILTIKKIPRWPFLEQKGSFLIITATLSITLFAIQLMMLKGGWFLTGWDVAVLSSVHDPYDYSPYYSRYPNQLTLAGIFQSIVTIKDLFTPNLDDYFALAMGGCMCISLSVFFTGIIARALIGCKSCYVAFLFSFFFIGLSPWFFVPYSDSYGILCPTLVLLLYTIIKKPLLKWPLLFFFSILGYHIKPTAIFILVAILLIELCTEGARRKQANNLDPNKQTNLRRSIATIFSIVALTSLSSFVAFALCAKIQPSDLDIDKNAAFSSAHFLMMGFNNITLGVYLEDDVAFSSSFDTPEDRSKAAIDKWKDRIENLGPSGTLKLMAKKCLTNYNDGSFAWGAEGHFFKEIRGSSELVHNLYRIPAKKDPQGLSSFEYFSHFSWIFLLVGCALTLLNRKPSKPESIIFLTLLMLSLFLMLFEARARYLYLYTPYFVIAGFLGWKATAQFLDCHKQKIQRKLQ